MKRFFTPRILNLISIWILLLALSISFFYEFFFDFKPCLLCILQRTCFFLVLIFLVVKYVRNTKSILLNLTAIVTTFLGIFFSSSQVMLQNKVISDESSYLCSPNLYTSFNFTSIRDFFTMLYPTEGRCSEISSVLLGASFATWSLLIFCSILVIILIIFFKERYS